MALWHETWVLQTILHDATACLPFFGKKTLTYVLSSMTCMFWKHHMLVLTGMEVRVRSTPSYPILRGSLFHFLFMIRQSFCHKVLTFLPKPNHWRESLKQMAGHTCYNVYMSILFFLIVCCFKVTFAIRYWYSFRKIPTLN